MVSRTHASQTRTQVLSLIATIASVVALSTLTTPTALAGECPNQEIREEQGSTYLPDCMAYEMVSPPEKQGSSAIQPLISENGDRLIFKARAGLAETEAYRNAVEGDQYVASRGKEGWLLTATAPPAADNFTTSVWTGPNLAASFTPDFSHWLSFQYTEKEELAGQVTIFEGGLDPSGTGRTIWQPRSSRLIPSEGLTGQSIADRAYFEGVSEDYTHIVFAPGHVESSIGQFEGLAAAYLPEDPRPATKVDLNAHNAYVLSSTSSGEPELALLARDSSGKAWGGNCGAWLGGGVLGGNGRGGRNAGAMSADGRRIYFSARAGQAQPNVAEPGKPACVVSSATNPIRILQRLETETGPQVEELFTSECTRVSPACSATNGDDYFEGASIDQTKVYFTTTRQLANADLDTGTGDCGGTVATSEGCDLYLYDADGFAGHHLIQVSAGESTLAHPVVGSGAGVVRGVTAISGDGSHVYFVATGVLTEKPNPAGAIPISGQPNFYVYDLNEPEGSRLSFIGTLPTSDAGFLFGTFEGSSGEFASAEALPKLGRDALGNEIGGDGHTLVFATHASLTPNDSDGGQLDLYRYDVGTGPPTLECVSCLPGGAQDSAPIQVGGKSEKENFGIEGQEIGSAPLTDFAENPRFASEDGHTIVFVTAEPLTGTADGLVHTYMWREESGTPRLVQMPPTGALVHQPAVSADGHEVAFGTERSLVGGDRDSLEDVYVARTDGGFAEPPIAAGCQGETCQGPSTVVLGPPEAASLTFNGSGNFSSPAKKVVSTTKKACPKTKKKVVQKGKLRCVKPIKRAKRRAHHKRRNAR